MLLGQAKRVAAATKAPAHVKEGQQKLRDEEQPLLKATSTAEKAGPAPGKAAGETKAAKVSPGKIVKLAKKTSDAEALPATVRSLGLVQSQVSHLLKLRLGFGVECRIVCMGRALTDLSTVIARIDLCHSAASLPRQTQV
jgi:hypothetical protein